MQQPSYQGMPGLQIAQQQGSGGAGQGQGPPQYGQPQQQAIPANWRPGMMMPGQQQQQQQQQIPPHLLQQQQQQQQMHHGAPQAPQLRMPMPMQHQIHPGGAAGGPPSSSSGIPNAGGAYAPAPPQPSASMKNVLSTRDLSQAHSSAEILRQHKRRKPTDRSLPSLAHDEQLENLKKEYEKLIEMERTLDATCTRKKAELLDEGTSLKKTTWKNLRVRISNTCASQEWQEEPMDGEAGSSRVPDFDSGKGIPNWTVNIEGKLVDIEGVSPAPDSENDALPKFTQVVQHLSIDIKRPEGAQYREPALLNWQPSQNTPPTDGFSFTRSGTSSSEIQIALYPAQHPRRYKVAPELGNLLDIREESKLGILNAMWSYIQHERLLENSSNAPEADRRNIKLDEQLSRLFGGAQKMTFYQISEQINRYLSSPDPVLLNYTVDVTPSHADAAKTYDILIEIADPAIRTSHSLLRALAPNAPISQEIMKLDDQIASLASSIRTSVYQHTLLSNFSNNPVTFMNEWMESQSLDLQDLLDPDPSKFKGTEGEWKLERLRDSDWFKQDWVKQAVGLHVARAQAVPPR